MEETQHAYKIFWLEYAPQNSNWILRLGKQAFDDEFLVTKKSDLFIHGAGAFVLLSQLAVLNGQSPPQRH
jgi:hypothetical protein